MTTYHVELKGYCDVIVEANSEQEAFDRAVEMIPPSSLSIETAEVKGVLEGEALQQAYRYFPEHLAMVDTEKFESESFVLYTKEMQDADSLEADKIFNELTKRKAAGEHLDWIDEEFLEQHSYINGLVEELIPKAESYKDKMMACFDEDDNFVGLVGVQANGTYKIVSKGAVGTSDEDPLPTVDELLLAQKVIMRSHKQLMKEGAGGGLCDEQDHLYLEQKRALLIAHATLMMF